MKFGIDTQIPVPRPWRPESELKAYREALERAELAESLGFDCVWVQEHHCAEEYCHVSAPEVFMAAVSQRTKTIRLGLGVSVLPPPFSPPLRIAERIATLDLVSEGRVEWATGASSDEMGLSTFHIPRDKRHEMWEEALRQIVRLFVEEPYGGYKGKYVDMPPRNMVPKPLQKPHPPIWVGCSSRDTIIKAAQYGIGALALSFASPAESHQWVDAYYSTLREEAVPVGYAVNPNLAVLSRLACFPTEEEAVAKVERGTHFWWYSFVHYFGYGNHRPGRTSLWENFARSDYKFLWDTATFGTPDKIRQSLREYEEAGIDQMIFGVEDGHTRHEDICQSMELFAKEVMPEFKERDQEREARKREEMEPIMEKIMARKEMPPEPEEIPVVRMAERRPWYKYLGMSLDSEGFPILEDRE